MLGVIGVAVTGFATPSCRTCCKPSQRPGRRTWNQRNSRKKRFVSARETSADDATRTLMRSSRNSSSRDGRMLPLRSATADEEGVQGSSTTTTMPPDAALLPLLLLNVVTLLWGTQHAVIKLILQDNLSPGVTNFARFGIAALLFSPWTPGILRDPPSVVDMIAGKKVDACSQARGAAAGKEIGDGVRDGDDGSGKAGDTWRAGAELGVWMFLGFAFQAVGLGFTTARSAKSSSLKI